MKQTAVEWLEEIINKNGLQMSDYLKFTFEQAKEMHKEEMINFGNDLLAQNDINYIGVPNLAEQYYNETYGGNK